LALWIVGAFLALSLGATVTVADDDEIAPEFGDWAAPANVGSPPNGPLVDQTPAISRDELTLYFLCIQPVSQGSGPCPGGLGAGDIWFSERASVNDPWGPPQNPGPAINTAALEGLPDLSDNDRTMYFTSTRPGGFGLRDLYVSHRHNPHDNFGWEPAENLGPSVNTAADEDSAAPLRVHGRTILYFNSNRAGGPGLHDIYATTLEHDGTFGTPELVSELSSPSMDQGVSVRRDGLELFMNSDRPGTVGAFDLWVSTRADTADPWSTPVNLGAVVNTAAIDGGPEISCDGTTLYFHSNRPGGIGASFDLWLTTRPGLGDEGDCGDDDGPEGDEGPG
jgi:hypothetical protein